MCLSVSASVLPMREFICLNDFNGNVKNDVYIFSTSMSRDRNINLQYSNRVYYNMGAQFIHRPNTDAIAYGIRLL